MKVVLITRSTLYSIPGGDTVQVVQTARQLTELHVDTEIVLSNQEINYDNYDLLHFFNITRPADILYHSKKSKKPYVVSTILCNYSEYDKHHRKGLGILFGTWERSSFNNCIYLERAAKQYYRNTTKSGYYIA